MYDEFTAQLGGFTGRRKSSSVDNSRPLARRQRAALLGHSLRMYDMDQLLTMLTIEKARELRFRGGRPPVIVSEDEEHSLQGPPITGEDVVRLLRSISSSREMRDLRESGAVQFIYTTRGRSPFLVRARMEDENVVFDVS